MRGAVDAAREAAHDVDAALGELPGEIRRVDEPAPRRAPRADDADRRLRERREIPREEEERRRVGDLAEQSRIAIRPKSRRAHSPPSREAAAARRRMRVSGGSHRRVETPAQALPFPSRSRACRAISSSGLPRANDRPIVRTDSPCARMISSQSRAASEQHHHPPPVRPQPSILMAGKSRRRTSDPAVPHPPPSLVESANRPRAGHYRARPHATHVCDRPFQP